MRTFTQHYIGGSWIDAASGPSIEVFDSATEEVLARVPAATADEVDAAVCAAHRAFDTWSMTSGSERAEYLEAIAVGLAKRADELTEMISRETGMPSPIARVAQVQAPIDMFNAAAKLALEYPFEEREGGSLLIREPAGVVGCITPWNFPLGQIAAKVAYALAAGCTIVLKPSEVAPTSAYVLSEVIEEIGFAGVFNLVVGDGRVAGEALAGHPMVDMLSFTGSTLAGKRVAELAAATVKRVALELGGKSANVVLDDVVGEDFAHAVEDGVGKAFFNSGQTCAALTRLLVPAHRIEEAERIASAVLDRLKVGDPAAYGVDLGPLASQAQYDRVQGYIQAGIDEGARLLGGGLGKPEHVTRGYYARPTVFSRVTPAMTIAQEEIFGPVLSIMAYDSEAEAVKIANNVVYGLAGGVWSADSERALSFARKIRTGCLEINGAPYNLHSPFGGYKQSGVGRERGAPGLEEFCEYKSIQLPSA
ncbi:aldehyde dehydrogenase family protein [Actinomadura madurae]|uniref:aldehyde dehydrogenase family protein n=1 Tax=Actinomadura madurae TaxID=1993 RepID=UPI003999A14E